MLDPSGNSNIETFITCPKCQGYGLEKKVPILCDCPTTFCMKCENTSGYTVRPYETCETCYGEGQIKKKSK